MKESYRQTSMLTVFSKIIEKDLVIQMADYFGDIFNKQKCGLAKAIIPRIPAKNFGNFGNKNNFS